MSEDTRDIRTAADIGTAENIGAAADVGTAGCCDAAQNGDAVRDIDAAGGADAAPAACGGRTRAAATEQRDGDGDADVCALFVPGEGFEPDEERIVDERDAARCEALRERYRERCRDRGPDEATGERFAAVCADWLAWLDADDFDPFDCEADKLCALAVTMTDSLASRDALIMTLVGPEGARDPADFIGFAVHPHAPGNAARMERELNAAFAAQEAPDVERILRGVEICERAAQIVPDGFAAHPLAVAAYGMWWIGDSRALETATQAIMLDEGMCLAGIILTALLRGVAPQWIGSRP